MLKQSSIILFVVISFSNTSFALTDNYRIMWRNNPATSMVIGWDQVSGTNPIIYYDTVDQGTNPLSYSFFAGVDRTVAAYGMNNHFTRLTGLLPNTNYYFVIQDSEGVSNRFWFKTTPNTSTERLSFIAGGDSRNNRTPRQNANSLVAKLRPHAVLFGGDYTDSGTNTQWLEWMEDWQLTIGADGRMIPIVPARGNHESSNQQIIDIFDVASNDIYYQTIFGGNLLSIYTLNTEISISGSQTTWLSTTLNTDNSIYKLAQYHKPVRPHTIPKAEGINQYVFWIPLFDFHQVDLVVECDSHMSKNTWPIVASSAIGNDEGFIRDDADGTVYIGEGCWGAPLRTADDDKAWTRNSGSFNQIKWIFVDSNKIEVRTIVTNNATLVGTVDDSNIFTSPNNLNIWNPSNGSVIYIPSKKPCNRDPILANNLNRWIGPLNGNWYDNPNYWSKSCFPTNCDDVLIDLIGASISLTNTQRAYGFTLEVTNSELCISNGAEMEIMMPD